MNEEIEGLYCDLHDAQENNDVLRARIAILEAGITELASESLDSDIDHLYSYCGIDGCSCAEEWVRNKAKDILATANATTT